MTIASHYTHRALPISLDYYEFADRCRYTWRLPQDISDEDALAMDCVSSDGAELTFATYHSSDAAFRAGRELGFLERVDALRASRQYRCQERFMQGWQFAQRWKHY